MEFDLMNAFLSGFDLVMNERHGELVGKGAKADCSVVATLEQNGGHVCSPNDQRREVEKEVYSLQQRAEVRKQIGQR